MAAKDRYNFVFSVLLLHGIGALVPWNMLITADRYFVDYKLKVTNSSAALDNYRTNFLSYMGIASKAPNLLFQVINMFANTSPDSLSTRISITLVVQSIIFVLTIILAIVDSTGWPELFFWVTMLSAVVINIANGVYQGCLYGAAAKLPMEYTNAVTTGINLSGTIASLFMIVSIAITPGHKSAAIIFFTCALVILILCAIGEYFLRKNEFYVYHTKNEPQMELIDSNKNVVKDSTGDEPDLTGLVLYRHVFNKIWLQLLNIILIYFVSLSVFPALMADITPVNGIISDKYFSPVFCFLSFNLFATFGNFIAQKYQSPSPKYLIIFTSLRLLFIPFFLLCNYRPRNVDRSLPVWFANDFVYILGGIAMSVSSGHLSSLCMMYAPRCVDRKYSSTAGMMAALTILLGILIGLTFSLVYPQIAQIG